MNNFIKDDDVGIEEGSGAGFAKDFIKNSNLKLTDLGDDDHLDFKKIDAQNMKRTTKNTKNKKKCVRPVIPTFNS